MPVKALEWGAIVGAVVFLIVLPFGHVVAVRSLSLTVALVATALLWFSSKPRYVPLLSVFSVWLLAAGLSLLTSSDPHNSIRDISGEIIRSFCVFFVFFFLTERYVPYRVWAVVTCASAIAFSTAALAAFIVFGEWTTERLPTLGDFATSAITILPVTVGYVAFATTRGARGLALLASVAMLAAAYLTFSRSVWLVLSCGAVVGVVLYEVRYGRRVRSLVPLFIVAACGLALVVAATNERGLKLLRDAHRPALYTAVANKVVTNPWTGTGYGHETDKKWYANEFPGESIFHAHNIVLSFIDQMGILGLVALAMIFGVPARLFVRNVREGRDDAVPAALTGVVLVICVFVKNSFDYFFVNQNLWLFFAYLGVILGEMRRVEEGPTLAGPLRAARL